MRISYRPLYIVVLTTALLLVGAGLVLGSGAVHTGVPVLDVRPPPLWRLALAAALTVLAQLARVDLRAGTSKVTVAWGDAALIVLCFLVPVAWVGPATALGVSLARIIPDRLGLRDGSRIVPGAANL